MTATIRYLKGSEPMMEQHKGYWISGTAVPGPPYTTYWTILGTALKPGRASSIIEIARLKFDKFTLDYPELAEWFGLEISRIAVDEFLSPI